MTRRPMASLGTVIAYCSDGAANGSAAGADGAIIYLIMGPCGCQVSRDRLRAPVGLAGCGLWLMRWRGVFCLQRVVRRCSPA